MRNYNTFFRAFYEMFPYGQFAHFTANSAILRVVPTHVILVHIVDFDISEGSQWPPITKAIARSSGLHLKVKEMDMAQTVKIQRETN